MKSIWRIIKKEYIYISRDRRTFFFGILSPILFVCLLNYSSTYIISDFANQSDGVNLAEIILSMVLTMMMFLSILTGALEIGVGEKERGTLRSVLRTGISFRTLFLGKYLTIVIQGEISLIVADIIMILLSLIPNSFFCIAFDSELFVYKAVYVNIILIMCVFLFSSVELLISFFARSFKEAQILSLPLMMLVLIPFYFVMLARYNFTSSILYYIPFLNIPLLFSNIVQNCFSLYKLLSFGSINVVVIVIATKMIFAIMSKESSLIRR